MSNLPGWLKMLNDKSSRPLLPILEDMRGRENAVLICSFGGDDLSASISAHVSDKYGTELATGLALLAEAGGVNQIILYAAALELEALAGKLKEKFKVTVVTGPSSPVLREPTALYSAIDTGVIRSGNAEEEYKKTFLSYGYQGRPTLVVDAETAYQAFRLSKGLGITKHVAVMNGSKDIKEADIGAPLLTVLENAEKIKVALLGGVCGKYLSGEELVSAVISYTYHFDSIRILGDGDCIVAQTSELYRSIKDLSCQKCVLCREGSWQLSAIFGDMTDGKASRDDITLIEDIAPLILAGALCRFGKEMVMPALSAVASCREEITDHVVGKNCREGQCRGLLSYLIAPSLCTGCGECLDVCPEEAIEGEDGFIHMIDEKLCIKCGKCVPACPEGAIKCGGEKIKVPKKLTKVGKFH